MSLERPNWNDMADRALYDKLFYSVLYAGNRFLWCP